MVNTINKNSNNNMDNLLQNNTNSNINIKTLIKQYGMYCFIYFLLFITFYKLNLTTELLLLTLVFLFIIYYSYFFNSPSELIEESKKTFNDIRKELNKDTNSVNNENNKNNETDKQLRNVIQDINYVSKISSIRHKIYDFIDNNVRDITYEHLQYDQNNNKDELKTIIDKELNKYIKYIHELLNVNSLELTNYQLMKNAEKEIYTTIHRIIFIDHKLENAVSDLIEVIKHFFKTIDNELENKVNTRISHNTKEYIPNNDEAKPANLHNDTKELLLY